MLLGKRIKTLRKSQKMTLSELSKKSGVQIATLSRIENLKMTGRLESHINIAQAFGIDVTELYKEMETPQEPAENTIEENTTDSFTYNDRASYEILTNNVLSKKMMPIVLRIEENGETNKEQNQHGTEKFLFVLEGSINVQVGEKSFNLSSHNTLYFDAAQKHQIVNAGNCVAKIISIVTPVAL